MQVLGHLYCYLTMILCFDHGKNIVRLYSPHPFLKTETSLSITLSCFRYAKVNESLTSCTIGAKISVPIFDEDPTLHSIKDSVPFLGQIGPVYLFSDAISSEQVHSIHSLGPSYMYSFLENEAAPFYDHPLPSGILDAKDGLASKIIFGLNAQVCSHTWTATSLLIYYFAWL